MLVKISEITVRPGRRGIVESKVEELSGSMDAVGLLNPITLDRLHTLIAGLHRLEAAKRLGWVEIECNVTELEGPQAELAEIDENLMRNELPTIDLGEILLHRKEVYEQVHPETKNGGNKRKGSTRIAICNSGQAKGFVKDTAEKLGVDPSTVARQVQAARNMTPAAKEIIRQSGRDISKTAALSLSRLRPEEQEAGARIFSTGQKEKFDEFMKAARKKNAPKGTASHKTSLPEAQENSLETPAQRQPEVERTGESTSPVSSPLTDKVIPAATGAEQDSPARDEGDLRTWPLTDKTRTIYRQSGLQISPEAELALSKLPPEQQAEAAHLYACGKIDRVTDYRPGESDRHSEKPNSSYTVPILVEPDPEDMEKPYNIPHISSKELTTEEIVAEMKSHEKDASAEPWVFLEAVTRLADQLCNNLASHLDEYYAPIFPDLNEAQMQYLRQRMDRIIMAANNFYQYVEGENKNA